MFVSVISIILRFGYVVALRLDFVFFFQAEDGIRDLTVTGVQTCALPISPSAVMRMAVSRPMPEAPPVTITPRLEKRPLKGLICIHPDPFAPRGRQHTEIGRASCRERV